MLFLPKMYQHSIHEIDYEKLYQLGIRCLLFDLDNTVGLLSQTEADKKTKALFKRLSKKFHLAIVSNHISKKRVSGYAKGLNCAFYHFAMKPSRRCLRKAMHQFSCEPKEICMIGDQLLTDILVANRFGAYSCLVDALHSKEFKITSLNRKIENQILKYYQKRNLMKKGEYYG